jgi:hypothetical protein
MHTLQCLQTGLAVHVMLLLLAVGQQACQKLRRCNSPFFGIMQHLVVDVQGTVERITRITLIDVGLVGRVFEKGSAKAWHGQKVPAR